jgi:hypothetical protein
MKLLFVLVFSSRQGEQCGGERPERGGTFLYSVLVFGIAFNLQHWVSERLPDYHKIARRAGTTNRFHITVTFSSQTALVQLRSNLAMQCHPDEEQHAMMMKTSKAARSLEKGFRHQDWTSSCCKLGRELSERFDRSVCGRSAPNQSQELVGHTLRGGIAFVFHNFERYAGAGEGTRNGVVWGLQPFFSSRPKQHRFLA